MFCPNCGAQIPDNASFCGSCGTRLGGVQVASQPRAGKVQAVTPQTQQPPAQPSAPASHVPAQASPARPAAQSTPSQPPAQAPAYQQPAPGASSQLPAQAPAYQSPAPGASSQPLAQSAPFPRQAQLPLPAQPQQQVWGGANQQWSPASTTEWGGGPRRIMDDRNILKILLLIIVTCGIYAYVFVYQMAQDMNTMCEDDDQSTGGLLSYVLLSIVTCGLYGIVWEYKIANRIAQNAPAYGFEVRETGDTLLLWRLIGVVTFGLGALYGEQVLCENMNRLARAYNRKNGFA